MIFLLFNKTRRKTNKKEELPMFKLKVFQNIVVKLFVLLVVFVTIHVTHSSFIVPNKVNKGENLISPSPTGETVKRIVIDPGHGGKDPGAIGTGKYKATEADIVLDISMKLKEYIQENFPDVEVVMTRENDVFIPLKDRTKIANNKEADLFISLHCNSASSGAHGSETYVLGMHKTEAQLQVAQRENQVIYLEDDYEEHYEGFDPSSPESVIALSMMQKAFLDKSIALADMIQYQFRERVKRHDRGVKQAGFWVISRTVMPAVLIELGFVSNAAEEDFLNSEVGKTYLASGIYRAFKKYKLTIEGYSTYEDYKAALTNPETAKEQTKVLEGMPQAENLEFRIQLLATKKRMKLKSKSFDGIDGVEEEKEGEIFKYTVGRFSNFEKAIAKQREVRNGTFKDAYIIAFHKGKRISLPEAMDILKKVN